MVLRKIAVARFTRTLGTLISSGVPILEGLDITARTSGNAVVEKAISQTRKAVEAGRSLVDPLKETDVFPGMVTQMIGVGEQTGAMDAMLSKIADFYEDEVDAAVKDMLTAIEPIMIVVPRRRRRRRRHFHVFAAVLVDRQTGRDTKPARLGPVGIKRDAAARPRCVPRVEPGSENCQRIRNGIHA